MYGEINIPVSFLRWNESASANRFVMHMLGKMGALLHCPHVWL